MRNFLLLRFCGLAAPSQSPCVSANVGEKHCRYSGKQLRPLAVNVSDVKSLPRRVASQTFLPHSVHNTGKKKKNEKKNQTTGFLSLRLSLSPLRSVRTFISNVSTSVPGQPTEKACTPLLLRPLLLHSEKCRQEFVMMQPSRHLHPSLLLLYV